MLHQRLNRRRALRASLALTFAGLARPALAQRGRAAAPAQPEGDGRPSPTADRPSPENAVPIAVAEGVYVFPSRSEEISPSNAGVVGNTGFIRGRDGVVVIDTGPSYRRGQAILGAIASVTDKPVVRVVVTHALQEFLFGNGAFAERAIPIVARSETVQLMRERCATCLANLRRILGDTAMAGTELVLPDRPIDTDQSIDGVGRDVALLHFGWGATPGDLVVLDRATGVAFAGALVSVRRVPSTHDARLEGWLAALEKLAALGATTLVPAYGAVAGPEAIEYTARYLRALDERVRAVYADGISLLDAQQACELPEYRDWALYRPVHGENVQRRYLEIEQHDLGR